MFTKEFLKWGPLHIEKIANKNVLHATWYEAGAYVYYKDNDFDTACKFWKKVGELGHPYVRSNFTIIPYKKDIIYCGNQIGIGMNTRIPRK